MLSSTTKFPKRKLKSRNKLNKSRITSLTKFVIDFCCELQQKKLNKIEAKWILQKLIWLIIKNKVKINHFKMVMFLILSTTHLDFQWFVYSKESWRKCVVLSMKTQSKSLSSNHQTSIFGMEKNQDCTFSPLHISFMNLKSTQRISNNKLSFVKSMSISPTTYLTLPSYWPPLME